MTPIFFDSNHDDNTRLKNLYSGAIYVFSPTPSGIALQDFAAEFCKDYFQTQSPTTVQHELPVSEFIETLKRLKPEFIHHPSCKKLIAEILSNLNCDQKTTYFDVPRIRTACAGDYLSSGLAYAFKPHRDTWYSTPMSQINWWMPIFPIGPDNGMAFHFDYWDRPIKNSSYQFNYQEWNQTGRKQAHNQGNVDKRVQSEALEEIKTEPATTLICEPGGLIVFSAAHLHSTIPNTSNETRISIDFRTVNESDVLGGAMNLDSESTGTTMMDYMRLCDLEHFPAGEIESHANSIPQPQFSSAKILNSDH